MLSRWKSKDKSEKSSKSSSGGKKKRKGRENEEDWHGDGSRIDGGLSDGEASRGPSRNRSSRRDDPRRHTLAGANHLYVHPLHAQHNAHDLEPPLPRGYPPHNALLFDDDPGIMSEVETASTGFRRGGKQRSSLPVVRTPSKTLERPLGLVFLQYRNETKRALLPNEITSIDTVKALFVRSFPKQLTMQYMDSQMVKIYIHDSSKDMFYELEDDRCGPGVDSEYLERYGIPPYPHYVYPQTEFNIAQTKMLKQKKKDKRNNRPLIKWCRRWMSAFNLCTTNKLKWIKDTLQEISDRSILRLFGAHEGAAFPASARGPGVPVTKQVPTVSCSGPSSWEQDTYFSEPEVDSDYHNSHHVHKSKVAKAPAYYFANVAPSTLPRGGPLHRAFSPAAPPVPADRVKTGNIPAAGHASEGYMSSPERGAARAPYEEPYYMQFLGPAAGRPTIAPIIDEEAGDAGIIEDAYQMYDPLGAPCPLTRPPYVDGRIPLQIDVSRQRVEKMERQLASLTGLVQKALQTPSGPAPPVAPRQDIPNCTGRPAQDPAQFASVERPPKLGRDKFQKSVSFEKSVSFSDDPPDMNSPKQHSPLLAAESKPTKPAIKSSTLPRTSSQERDRLKPAPPPKPAGLSNQQLVLPPKAYTITVSSDFMDKLQNVQKQIRDVRIEARNLRRSAQAYSIQIRQMMADAIVQLGTLNNSHDDQNPDAIIREEELYRQDMLLLENNLFDLENTVERLRGQAANRYNPDCRETRVNMADIERIAMVLSKSSKTVADWKIKFPSLQETTKARLATEMEKIVRKEKMLEDEPERLELALRRCKKLTGTLVTLKRLACVQEQRLPITDGRVSPSTSQGSSCMVVTSEDYSSDTGAACSQNHNKGGAGAGGGRAARGAEARAENALDALLDELQTFAKPSGGGGGGGSGRLHSYPSGSDTDASPPVRARGQHPAKPPVPERHPELLALAARRAPPPPPPRTTSRSPLASPPSPASPASPPETDEKAAARQALLEHRHQELLKKQKALQEQYARLQMIQRSGSALPPAAQPDLKKTGSESNLLTKMNLNLAPAAISGSMTHLAADSERKKGMNDLPNGTSKPDGVATTNKVYETDIL